jgi:hypothetical protein
MAQAPDDKAWLAGMMANLTRNAPYAKPSDSYQTPLEPPEEGAFRTWVQKNGVPFNPDDQVTDYDMRGYWRSLQRGADAGTAVNPNDGQLHYPDTYKTPYHQSFSAESIYAKPNAPVWINDHQLADPKTGKVIFDERSGR